MCQGISTETESSINNSAQVADYKDAGDVASYYVSGRQHRSRTVWHVSVARTLHKEVAFHRDPDCLGPQAGRRR